MQQAYQIPRISLGWLLGSLVAVMLPHFARLPIWLSVLCGACVVGRILIFHGRLAYPGSLIKTVLVITLFVSVALQYGRDIFSADATVAILIASMALKLLEMRKKRDVLLVVYLCYFCIIAEFIYSQTIIVAIYMSFCVWLITCALMSLNQAKYNQKPLRTFKLTGTILAQCIPLMLILFVLFPRIPPFWSVPLQSSSGVTGLSDTMSPGDIGELISSPDIAFRVQFNSAVPSSTELYWRGITLDVFEGREWRRGFNLQPQYLGPNPNETRDWFNNIEYLGNKIDYNVIMEPTFTNWIFTLKMPQIFDERLIMRREYQVDSIRRIGQRFTYDVSSYLDHRVDEDLNARELRRARSLPEDGNPQSRAFAQALRQQSDSDEDFIQDVLNHFRQEQFFYTLSPALLGENSIDDFLFISKEGFCEHFSSTFTYLMRAAGIPARVVTGYQGGELNPFDGTLTVRQYDAHAWSEVWIQGRGWIRIDPTAAVSPDRIDLGSQQTLQTEESFLNDAGFSMLRFRDTALLNNLRLRLEMLDYSWHRFVLNYNQERQFDLLNRLFNSVTQQKVIYIMLSLLFISTCIVVIFMLRKPSKPKQHPATVIYLRYCSMLAKQGFARNIGETPQDYYQRLSQSCPQWKAIMHNITQAYIDIIYKNPDDESNQTNKTQHLKKLTRQFRLSL